MISKNKTFTSTMAIMMWMLILMMMLMIMFQFHGVFSPSAPSPSLMCHSEESNDSDSDSIVMSAIIKFRTILMLLRTLFTNFKLLLLLIAKALTSNIEFSCSCVAAAEELI